MLGLIALGVLSLAAFVVIELEVEYPLLNLRVFRNRLYTTSLIAMSVMMTGLFATLFYIPLFLQEGLGYPALHGRSAGPAAGPGDGRVHADRRSALRQDRAALPGLLRAADRRDRARSC